jgi:hypothetical protein
MFIIVLTFEKNSNVGIDLAQNYFVKLLLKKTHKERRRERERKGRRRKENGCSKVVFLIILFTRH